MYPQFMADCRELEVQLKLKRHVAIEWLSEGITLDCQQELHSRVIGSLSNLRSKIISEIWGKLPSEDYFTVLWQYWNSKY